MLLKAVSRALKNKVSLDFFTFQISLALALPKNMPPKPSLTPSYYRSKNRSISQSLTTFYPISYLQQPHNQKTTLRLYYTMLPIPPKQIPISYDEYVYGATFLLIILI